MGEILEDPCTVHTHGYALTEYTSSGITHSEGEFPYIGSVIYWLQDLFVPQVYSVRDFE